MGAKKKPHRQMALADKDEANRNLRERLLTVEADRAYLRNANIEAVGKLVQLDADLEAERNRHDKTDATLQGLLKELAGRSSLFVRLAPLVQVLIDMYEPESASWHMAKSIAAQLAQASALLGPKLPTDDPMTWKWTATFDVPDPLGDIKKAEDGKFGAAIAEIVARGGRLHPAYVANMQKER